MPDICSTSIGRWFAALAAALSLIWLAPVVHAAMFEWAKAVDGDFNDPQRWNLISGSSSPPPRATDVSVFNKDGTYTVRFDDTALSDVLSVLDGFITFASDSATQHTYKLNDAQITGGFLDVGTATNPLFLNLETLSVADGVVSVDGGSSRLDVTGNITHSVGLSGAFGGINVLNGARANIAAAGGTLNVAVSTAGTQGDVTVAGGGTINTGHVRVATNNSSALGSINVAGSGSQFNQTLPGASLTLGSASGGIGALQISEGTFNGGTGSISVNRTGEIIIRNGGTFNAKGDMEVDGGSIIAQGRNSNITLNGAGRLIVGHATGGTATLEVLSGAIFSTGAETDMVNATGEVKIDVAAFNTGGDFIVNGGSVNVGFGTSRFNLAAGHDLTIDNGGRFSSLTLDGFQIRNNTTVNVQNGGTMDVVSLDIAARLSVGDGTLNVDGSGSIVTARGFSLWGGNGDNANVRLSNEALLQATGLGVHGSADTGATGNLEVLSAADIAISRFLHVGTVGGDAMITVDGEGSRFTQSSESDDIIIGHASSGSAVVNVHNNATFTTGMGTTTVNASGRINVDSGAVFHARGPIHMEGGEFNLLGGTFVLENTFDGDLVNRGGTLRPVNRSFTNVTGDYTQRDAAKLEFEIGGPTLGQYDFLVVEGEADLDGDLEITLADGFLPSTSDSFIVLSAADIDDDFDNVGNGQRLTATNVGGSFVVHYGSNSSFDPNQVVLTNFVLHATGGLPGDFNNDGVVDAADYVAWRKTGGSQQDYNTWRANFGETADNGQFFHAPAAVPEPESGWLLFGAAAIYCAARKSPPITK